MERLTLSALFLLQVWQVTSFTPSPSPKALACAPEQEIICPSNNTFAWCLFTNHQDRCPSGLFCDPSLSYICSEDPPLPTLTTPSPETTTDPTEGGGGDQPPLIDWEENEPWDENATPPTTCTKPGRFADSSECSVFHVCLAANLTHMVVRCPQGSHFSAKHDKCVEPERAKCMEVYQNFECPDIGPVADPEDCAAFRICHRDGTWRRYYCPSNSTYNPHLRRCSASNQECYIPDPGAGRFVCTSRGLFPDAKSCRKFYYCIPSEGTFLKGEATCPRNSVFNPATLRCTIDLSICRDVDKFCDNRHPGKYPGNPEDCSSFYVCSTGGTKEYFCPYGSNYNAVSGKCEYESKSHCNNHLHMCRGQGKFPDIEKDCRGFFVCLSHNQRWRIQRYMCPPGSKFDYRHGRCMAEENVLCHMPTILL